MICYGVKKGENKMFIKKILYQVLRYPRKLREHYQEKQLLKKKNSRLAKLLDISRTIK